SRSTPLATPRPTSPASASGTASGRAATGGRSDDGPRERAPVNRLRLAGAVAIACALALGWLLWRSAAGDPWQEPADGAVAAGDVGNAAAPPAAVEGGEAGPPERAAVAPPARTPLPALDVPLRLVVDDLRRRADSGDAAAACRLAAEFERCR